MSNNDKKYLRPVSNFQLRTSVRAKTVEKRDVQKKDLKDDDNVKALKEKEALLLIEIETLKEANKAQIIQIEEEKEKEALLLIEIETLKEANKAQSVQIEERKEKEALLLIEIETLKEAQIVQREELKASFTALKEHNNFLGSLNAELKYELRQLIAEKESRSATVEAQISENGDVHLTTEGLASGFNETVSLNENGSSEWEKIHKDNFKVKNLNLKRDEKTAAEFVEYIKTNVFESDMTNFVQAAATVVFKREFFIEHLSYKHEKGRVCVKDSNVLQCLEASVESKFEVKNIGNFVKITFKNFKANLRRKPELWDEY